MSVQSISLQVPKVKKKRWGNPKPGESLKMLAAGSLAFAKAYSSVEKLEHELEAELQRDKDNDPERGEGIHKLRRKGGKMLLSKYTLLFIVALNILDCALVLGELILDLHHVKDILFDSQQSSEYFLEQLKQQYPNQFSNIPLSKLDLVYDKILESQLFWGSIANDSTLVGYTQMAMDNKTLLMNTMTASILTHENAPGDIGLNVSLPDKRGTDRSNQVEEDAGESAIRMVGYVFHKISLTISVILVSWVLLKIICFGRNLLHRRLEVFDTVVILASFVVDMIFVKGLSMYTLTQFVYILAFMLPWRVIRVTNSLVMVVKDHETIRLKMLFTQKKKIENDNKQLRAERENYKEQVDALKKLCLSEGIDDWKIFQSLARQQIKPGGKGAMGSFASLAFGAFGNKSGSFWSVLGTPKMRRGKSEDILAGNKIVHSSDTTVQSVKRHSKGKLLGFLGSSADYLRGKINRNGHHTSLDSDPGIQTHFKSSIPMQQNGHIGKRLVRGETIDTLSTESNDDITDRNCNVDDLSKQETVESSVAEADFSNAASPKNDLVFMHRAHSDSVGTRPPLQHGSRLLDSLDSMDIQRRASFGAMDSLTVHYRNPYNHSCSIDNIDGKNHGNA